MTKRVIHKEKKLPIVSIIEDDEDIRTLLALKLRKEGFDVFEAVDGLAGLDLIYSMPPDLVLLDILMPNIDGFEVLKRIKNSETLFHIPVIIMSNLVQREHIEKAKSMGALEYIVKANTTPGQIVDRVKIALNIPVKSVRTPY